jgi:hypothetical protein
MAFERMDDEAGTEIDADVTIEPRPHHDKRMIGRTAAPPSMAILDNRPDWQISAAELAQDMTREPVAVINIRPRATSAVRLAEDRADESGAVQGTTGIKSA